MNKPRITNDNILGFQGQVLDGLDLIYAKLLTMEQKIERIEMKIEKL